MEGERLLLERYRLGRRLGAGGFGVVWEARDERLQREVAVKVVPREPGDDARPEREARAAARLAHPAIVSLYELAGAEDEVYLVSELVRGRTLDELERDRAVADRDVARVGITLCDALEHAHARGVIHRDVKPQNVMVVADPAAGAGFAKLTDFGVAHLVGGDPLTRTGDVVGTLAYMAPEQAEGRRATPACDVYSLALTLYEAWTGGNPVRAASPAATARRLGSRLPSLASKRRDLPMELCDTVDDALHPDPCRRPTPGELGDVLRDVEPELSDQGGLVEPETLARIGFDPVPVPLVLGPRVAALIARLGPGVAAGALVAAGLATLGPEAPGSSLALAGLAVLVVAALPRVGWIASAFAVCAWLVVPDTGRAGTALVVAAALAAVPLLLPRAGRLWSLPALAPLLGAAGLAPAFVGIAGLVRGAWRRAGLGAAGFLWLAAAEAVTGHALLFGVADGTRPPASWEASIGGAAADAVYPALASPALLPVVAWAGCAAILPLFVRGRFLALDLVGAAVWAAALAAAHAGLGELVGAGTALEHPRGAALGAAAGALAAVFGLRIAPVRTLPDVGPRHAEPAAA